MKNWMQRLALFAAVGAILSSSVLVGCSSGEGEGDATTTPTTPAGGAAGDE